MFPSIADTYSPKPPARKRRQAPLRVCGQCARKFRSWAEGSLCKRCEEDGSLRAKDGRPAAGPNRVELGGPADDGSLHYLATGEPEPAP